LKDAHKWRYNISVKALFVFLFSVSSFFIFSQDLTVGQAVKIFSESENPDLSILGLADEDTLTASNAVQLLWLAQGYYRHRFFSWLETKDGMFEEALERGWLGTEKLPHDVLTGDEWKSAYYASRETPQVWIKDSIPRWWDWNFSNLVFTGYGIPYSNGYFFHFLSRLGLSIGDRDHGVSLQFGVQYRYEPETPSKFYPELHSLSYTLSIFPSSTWYHSSGFELGRFLQGESSGLIYSQILDGFRILFLGESFKLILQTGYSGFLDKFSALPMITSGDVTDFFNEENYFGPPRLLSSVVAGLYISDSFSFEIAGVIQTDFRKTVTPNRLILAGSTLYTPLEGGLYEGVAGSLFLDWRLGQDLQILSSFAFQFVDTLYFSEEKLTYREYRVTAMASEIKGIWQPESSEWKLSTKIFFSTGDTDARNDFREGTRVSGQGETFFQYRSWGAPSPGKFFTPDWGNLAGGGFEWIWSPTLIFPEETGYVSLGIQSFFRVQNGPVSVSTVETGGSSLYLGSEVSLEAVWDIWAETEIVIEGGFFVPNSAGAFSQGSDLFIWGGNFSARWDF